MGFLFFLLFSHLNLGHLVKETNEKPYPDWEVAYKDGNRKLVDGSQRSLGLSAEPLLDPCETPAWTLKLR